MPRLSPDSEKVAYAWTGAADDNWDIYVKALGIGTRPLRLTNHPGNDWSPAWSPDGRQIAFVRELDGAAIYTVPSLGGQERKVLDITGPVWTSEQGFVPALSWSPDGEFLIYAERSAENEPAHIVQLSLETLEKRPITFPPKGARGDFFPAPSPDGSQLAFMRSGSVAYGDLDVWLQPMAGGEARRLTFQSYSWGEHLGWTPDGRQIHFTVGAGGGTSIYWVGPAGGAPQPFLGLEQNTAHASARGSRLVYERRPREQRAIWRTPARKGSPGDGPTERWLVSSANDDSPAWSPDGRRIAFSSDRSGVRNIWVCESDGSNPVQLTDLEGYTGSPAWSPDGRRLAFDSMEGGSWNLYVTDVDSGIPQRLTQDPPDENIPSWSRDGASIYFRSDRSGVPEIWKVPADGGEAVQVTRHGGLEAQESWDGRDLYFRRSDAAGIWRMPVEGGEEVEVVGKPVRRGWAVVRDGLYFKTWRGVVLWRRHEYVIRFLDFESGRVSALFRKEGPARQLYLTVSPDERWMLFAEWPATRSELMLIESRR